MCLIAVAHRLSRSRPLVIAANRDEDYGRPTLAAHFWSDVPGVAGGRDGLLGGTWLAVTRTGRFAAVTNLRGAAKQEGSLSRGELVRAFVAGGEGPHGYVIGLERELHRYAGFHLLAGVAGSDLAFFSGTPMVLGPGAHAVSNAPAGEHWPKTAAAAQFLARVHASASAEEILEFLAGGPATGDPTRDVFIIGDRYGTRSSTAIIVGEEEIVLMEQSFDRGGVRRGSPVTLRFARG